MTLSRREMLKAQAEGIAAAATACALMKERRETAASERLVRDIGSLLASLMGSGMLVDKRGGEHARQFADCSHAFDDLVIIRGLKRDHHLARGAFSVNFDAAHFGQSRANRAKFIRPRMHNQAREMRGRAGRLRRSCDPAGNQLPA